MGAQLILELRLWFFPCNGSSPPPAWFSRGCPSGPPSPPLRNADLLLANFRVKLPLTLTSESHQHSIPSSGSSALHFRPDATCRPSRALGRWAYCAASCHWWDSCNVALHRSGRAPAPSHGEQHKARPGPAPSLKASLTAFQCDGLPGLQSSRFQPAPSKERSPLIAGGSRRPVREPRAAAPSAAAARRNCKAWRQRRRVS